MRYCASRPPAVCDLSKSSRCLSGGDLLRFLSRTGLLRRLLGLGRRFGGLGLCLRFRLSGLFAFGRRDGSAIGRGLGIRAACRLFGRLLGLLSRLLTRLGFGVDVFLSVAIAAFSVLPLFALEGSAVSVVLAAFFFFFALLLLTSLGSSASLLATLLGTSVLLFFAELFSPFAALWRSTSSFVISPSWTRATRQGADKPSPTFRMH